MVKHSHRSTTIALAAAALLALGAIASAKPAPVERQIVVAALDDAPVMVGPAGASLERDYFRAPSTAPFAAQRVFPCRMQLRMFEKTRVAQSCR